MSYVSRYSTAFWWLRLWSAVIGVGRGCPLLLVLALLLVSLLLLLLSLSLVLLVRVDDCGISRWWYAKAYLLCLCRTFGPSPPTLRWATKDTLAWCVPWQLRLGGARWVEGWTLEFASGEHVSWHRCCWQIYLIRCYRGVQDLFHNFPSKHATPTESEASGRYLATASSDETLRIWEVGWQAILEGTHFEEMSRNADTRVIGTVQVS